jgi:hypothetical protein
MMNRSELASLTKNIAADILASGLPLDADSRKALEAWAAEEPSDESRWLNVSVSFCTDPNDRWVRAARLEFRGETGWDDKVEDPETGDLVAQFNIKASFRSESIDCYDLDKAAAKLELAARALELAKQLKAKYAGTFSYVYKTKEEVARAKAEAEVRELQSRVKTMTEFPRKGLRVGGERRVERVLYGGVPDGEYEVSYDNGYDVKKYRVVVRPGYVRVVRLG